MARRIDLPGQPLAIDEAKARYDYVTAERNRALRRRERLKPGAARDNLSRHIGSLEFARLQILSNLQDLGDPGKRAWSD